MTLHHLLALEIAFLLAGNFAGGRPAVLGVVVQAHRAHVNTSAVSDGATVYDGDRFSTEAGGTLRLRGEAAARDLAEESTVQLRRTGNGGQEIEVELIKGPLAFSAECPTAVEIVAREARIRPVAEARTIAQVRVVGPKELRIYARRGALQFLYRGESETVAEGKSYRVILDPPEDPKKKANVEPNRQRKAFVIIVIGAESGVLVYELWKAFESPDRP
jgi:hypothetical protein